MSSLVIFSEVDILHLLTFSVQHHTPGHLVEEGVVGVGVVGDLLLLGVLCHQVCHS